MMSFVTWRLDVCLKKWNQERNSLFLTISGYSNSILSRKFVSSLQRVLLFRWIQSFRNGKIDTEDKQGPWYAVVTVRNEQTFLWMNEVTEENPHLSVSKICSRFDLSRWTDKKVIHDDLHLQRQNYEIDTRSADRGSEETEFCLRRNYTECLDHAAQNDHAMLWREKIDGHPLMGFRTSKLIGYG